MAGAGRVEEGFLGPAGGADGVGIVFGGVHGGAIVLESVVGNGIIAKFVDHIDHQTPILTFAQIRQKSSYLISAPAALSSRSAAPIRQ